MRSLIKKIAKKFGYDFVRLPADINLKRRMELLRQHNINLLFDIGANKGQFVKTIRELGYNGKIVSFEPLPDAFNILKVKSINDNNWEIIETAVGNFDGKVEINISKNSYSSSILDILPLHVESAPDSIYIDKITVPITKIDSIIDRFYFNDQNLFTKIDTQGFEKSVLDGCENSLDKIKGFQMELSIVPLYKGEVLMQDMVDILRAKGFKLMLIEGGHCSYTTGEMLQVEGTFYKQ